MSGTDGWNLNGGFEGFGDYEGIDTSGFSSPADVPNIDYGGGLGLDGAFNSNMNDLLNTKPEAPGFMDRLGSSFTSPQGIAALLNAGITTASGLAQASQAEKRDKQASEDARFNAMLQLAKLKYGSSGGGGNPLAGPQMQIEALEKAKVGRTSALSGLATNLGSIFARGGRG